MKTILDKNPIQLSGAIMAVVNFLILMEWVTMTDKQVAGANVALVAVLSLFIVSKTTNTAKLEELSNTEP
jgi:hypothetical protein